MLGALAILSGLLVGVAAELLSRRRTRDAGRPRLRVVQRAFIRRHGQEFGFDDPALS